MWVIGLIEEPKRTYIFRVISKIWMRLFFFTTGSRLKIKGIKSTHYFIQFNYKRKSKTVMFDDGFNGDPKLKDANEQMIKEIEKVLADEENKEISLK